MSALTRWADQLAGWRIPPPILATTTESPWVLPRPVFVRRADRQIADPIGATHAEAVSALAGPGNVLDIGAAAGASSLSLAGRAPVTEITAVDTDPELLDEFAARAARLGVRATCVRGAWPDTSTEPADVVIAGNVIYNVSDLAPFVTALTAAARRVVIVETAERHPLTALNELWRHFHGIERPAGPTADDAVAALAELGIAPRVRRWKRPPTAEHASYQDLLEVTRRRLCLPVGALPEIDAVLRRTGVDPSAPPDLGSSGDDLVTLVWPA
ncbi:class I SAM-dependent methyltransferase [Fodinicola acaciae]|uniref:class I SAM-dependent methyltransferase n=1 Tax=Fodinicola acaciae TaxID=2681555 RepID=UPI0013D3A054|nr:class I SAM-dependent methyltransferase [Fodinicola acaciae]